MPDDIFHDPEFREWADHVETNVVPMLRDSALTISLVPRGPIDVKFAVELGLSIMMDKPIIAVVHPGTQVPAKLVKVADRIIEIDLGAPGIEVALAARLKEIVDELARTHIS